MAKSKKVSKKIPRFRTEAEEARFWDTHDSTDYLDEFEPAKVTFPSPKPKALISIRIAKPEVVLLRRIAARKGLGYGSLIRMWLTERLLAELQPTRN
jgi:predicted DNA binding CopG/RHH family protein